MNDDMEVKGVLGSLEQRNLDPKIREGLEKLVKEILAVNSEFGERLFSIKKDDLLTPKGQQVKIQELGETTFESLEPYKDVYRAHLESTEKMLFQDPHSEELQPLEVMMKQMRAMELRTMYNVGEMDELELESHADQPGFLEAISTSPKPLLPESRLKHLIRKQAEKDNPQVAEKLDQYDFASGTVKGLIGKIESDVKGSGWKDLEDPLNVKIKPFVDEVKEMAK